MSSVQLANLSKVYPPSRKTAAFHAVKGINLNIDDGEFMVLVGPSGCGKSTTLRMIAGLEEATTGFITIDGRVVNDVLPKDRGVAMVFQNYALYPHMSVFDNMAFGLKIAKTPKDEIQLRVTKAAQILGLESLLARKPAALSGGQRQRVAVGRAIVRKPKVFLFDEPLSNLDAKMRVSMRTELSKLHLRLGVTMIYVTHDQIEAMTMGDRICVMKDGEIMQVAAPLDLYNRPANTYVAGFIGSPPMNLVQCRLQRNGDSLNLIEETAVPTEAATGPRLDFKLDGRLGAVAVTSQGSHLTLGFRPEDITNVPGPDHLPIRCLVELVEPIGAETHVYLRSAGHSLIARLAPGVDHPPASEIIVYINARKTHLFDTATGRALS